MRRRPPIALAFALLVAPAPVAAMGEEADSDRGASDRQLVRTAHAGPVLHRVGADRDTASRQCSADALPAAERRRMQIEYQRRLRADGKTSADAWVREQGRRFHQRLVAQGVCARPAERKGRTATAERPAEKRVVRGKDGRPCKRTRLENRNIANLGGGAMSMVLVPVCAD